MKRLRFTVEITTQDDQVPYKRLASILEDAITNSRADNLDRTFYLGNVKVLRKPARWAAR